MSNSPRRRTLIVVILAILLLVVLWLLSRCSRSAPKETAAPPAPAAATPKPTPAVAAPAAPAAPEPAEVLTPATLQAPPQVSAGAVFQIQWTGPDNRGDYLTIVRQGAAESSYTNYRETKEGRPLPLTAPIEPGEWELRYVTVRSHTVLGRAPITVLPIEAKLEASAEAIQGTPLSVMWTGPNNTGDYLTVVAKDTPEGQLGNYTYTNKGSPLTVTLPVATGDAELRYVTGQSAKVLARRPIKIVAADITLSAPAETVAGSAITVTWTGPNNPGDYFTVVAETAPDSQYGNYTNTNKGSPLTVTAPIDAGDAELRYVTGQSTKVLARRPIKIVAANITLSAPAEAVAGSAITVTWTGPSNPGDYFTVVAKTAPDSQYGNYTNTNRGSPLTVAAPKDAGEAEVRYVSGQGTKVLSRRPIKIVP